MTFSRYALLGGVLLLCLSSFYLLQPDLLQTRVSATYQDATLVEVLTDLRDQYNLKFAYLNNELPTEPNITLSVQNAPLHGVLDAILKDTSLSYQLVNNQIVLKNDPGKALQPDPEPELEKTSVPNQSSEAEILAEESPNATTSTDTNIAVAGNSTTENDLSETDNNFPDRTSQISGSQNNDSQNDGSQNDSSRSDDTENRYSSNTNDLGENIPEMVAKKEEAELATKVPLPDYDVTLKEEEVAELPPAEQETESSTTQPPNAQEQGEVAKKITETIQEGMDYAIFNNLPDESSYETRPLHIGFIYPLSTNGINAGQYVNWLSFHVLIGYSAGLNGVEASGFGNIENDFVSGVQAAGFFNLVNNRVSGVQAAGFLNLNGGTLEGGQFAGFLNTSLDSIEGVQGAGFLNVSTGYTDGVQGAGFSNIITQNAHAVQASGFANIATSNLKGAQIAGFGNYTHYLDGAQLAGFVNITTGDVKGFQGSGFINVARNVKGVQLSVFNVADSVDGVPIGLLSIVRKNGYRTLEVWGGETMYANIAYKIGVRKFYNIFSFGSQFADADFRYGLGYGVGHIAALSPTVDLSIDIIAQQVNDSDNPIFNNNQELNLLNSFRLGFAKQFSEHFGLFAGPTFNVLVSEVVNSDGTVGSNLAPYTFFDRTYNGRTNVQMWAGVNVGLRF